MSEYFKDMMPVQPSSIHFWLARIFGKKVTTTDSGHKMTAYHYRGVTYVTKFRSI